MKVEPRANRPNCFVIPPITGNTVLTYALETNPDPLRVGNNNASLQFIVTNITSQSQAVTSIVFGLPVGDGGITPTISGIQHALSDTVNWEASISPPSSGIANVTLTPQGGYSMPVNASVVLTLFDMQTVSSAGNSNITISETIGSSLTNGDFQVSVFPADFYFEGLAACVYDGSQLTPVAQVTNGNTITLTWQSSVADLSDITIYWSDPGKGQQSTSPTEPGQWTSPPLTCDTIFTVAATAEVLNGQPMTLSRTVAVSVLNPALVASSATISGDTSVSGNLSVNGAGTIAQSLRINGPSQSGQTPSLSLGGYGNFNVDAPGVVGGRFVVQDTSGNVGINTPNPTATLQVTGSTILNGSLTANSGSVSMLGTPQPIQPGSYTAPTDGFVVGNVIPPGDAGAQSYGQAFCYCNGITASATGGNIVYWMNSDMSQSYSNTNQNSFCLPIQNAAYFQVWTWIPSGAGNANPPTVSFYWIPIGSTTSPSLTEGDITDIKMPEPAEIRAKSDISAESETKAESFVQVMTDILGDAVSKSQKQRLREAILGIL